MKKIGRALGVCGLGVCGLAGLLFAPGAQAAPLVVLTTAYSIGTFSQALEFMGDGSVRVACDGSVSIACDGSVLPVPIAGASWSPPGAADGAPGRLATPLLLAGDGSVRVSADGSVSPDPTQDLLLLEAFSYSPNPSMTISIVFQTAANADAGSVSVVAVGGMNLGADAFTTEIGGLGTLFDARGDGLELLTRTFGDETGTVFGVVDGVYVAGAGLDAIFGEADGPVSYDYTASLVEGGPTACGPLGCTSFAAGFGFLTSGNGDRFALTTTFTVKPASVAVPAPAPLGLLAVGLLGLAVVTRRRG